MTLETFSCSDVTRRVPTVWWPRHLGILTWVQERRDWKILNRGKEMAKDKSKTELAQSIYKAFPKRGRIAETMAAAYPLTTDDI
jgi:hypothetical protein